jgi:CheY-like chemotaxis protein
MSSDRTQPLILVVDDDQILRIAAQECLESSGFSVIEAEDGVQAISQFREHSPDLVVLDVMMPIQNGFEVCRALRELPEGQSTPILILTGLCDTASIDQAFAAGATDFAEKPMNWAMFPRRIRYLLRGAQTAEELLRAHRAAETASRAKSEFLRKVTHELRTPMAAILGYVDAMEEEGALAAADGSTAERFERIRENGGSLLSMIESVVEVARVDPSAEPPHALNPADLAREVLDSQRREAEAKALVLGLSSAADLPTRVVVDEHSLRSILHHLVANGIKYTTDGSVQVELSCHRGARWTTLELCVRDTGVGIEAEHREAIFDPFVQLLGPGNAAPTGTGLGLTVVKRLVESLDACISIESEPGSGTAFLVRIPVTIPEGTLDEHETAATTESLRLDCRILYAEDGEDNRRLVQGVLQKAGAEVVLVSTGAEAVERVLRADPPFDLVLMDVQMPVMDGCEATRALRDAGVGIPILALTAHSNGGEQERCLASGCTDYLTKPIRPAELIASVAGHVGTSRKQEPSLWVY